jgi:hypothetical protein
MASALSQIGGHGTSEGGDGLKVLPLLQLMLRVKPCWAICMMVQDVGSLLGRAGCRLRRNGGEEADPPCSGAHPDWQMFQTGFSARGSLQDPGPEAKETQRRMGYWNRRQTMISFPYRYCYRGTGVLLPNVSEPLSKLLAVPLVGLVGNVDTWSALEAGLGVVRGHLARRPRGLPPRLTTGQSGVRLGVWQTLGSPHVRRRWRGKSLP